jgi:uncharacterized protein involved in exopolysaccharide biosynthesis
MDLKFYLSRFVRRLHYVLILLALGSAIGITLSRILPPVYVAEARMVVESGQIPDELAASTVRTGATEQLEIIQQRILTRDKLLEMANRLQIYAPSPGQPAPVMDADDVVKDLRDRIVIMTTGGAETRGPAQAVLVTVSFEAPTAALSAAVTNDLVTLILQENVAMRTTVARQTLDFFVQEVAGLDQDLATRGAAILAFKEKNQEALPDSLDFRRSQQAAAQERLLQLTREETEVKDRRDRLIRLHDAGQSETVVATTPQTPEQKQLQTLRDALAAALVVLSPENPKVKLLEAQVASAERVVAVQLATGGGIGGDGAQLSAYEIQLEDLKGQLAFVADQKAQVAIEMEALLKSIEATPSNAIALETLERDYANVRAQYDQAVANKARAETGDMIEALAKGQRITVIEQAVAPREPSRPNRLLIAVGGVVGGLMLGLGLAALLEVMNTSIRRPADLTKALGITPFATLPYLRTARQIRRRRMIMAAIFGLVLIAIPALLWLIHTQVTPLDLLLDGVLGKLSLAMRIGTFPTAVV